MAAAPRRVLVPCALLLLSLVALTPPVVDASSAQSEVEPNSTAAQATALPSAATVLGELSCNADPSDWFVVEVSVGEEINLSLEQMGGLDADLEAHLQLPDGTVDVPFSHSPYRYEALSVLAPADGPIDIRVHCVGGAGAYLLSVDVAPVPILLDGQSVGGSLSNSSYRVMDFYRVWLDASAGSAQRLTASMDKEGLGGAPAYLELRVLHQESFESRFQWVDLSWGSATFEQVNATATEPGWYYLRVNAYNGAGTYLLQLSVATVSTDGDNLPPTAPLPWGQQQVSGTLHQDRDRQDRFGVELAAGEGVRAHLSITVAHPSIFRLVLLDPQGGKVAVADTWSGAMPTNEATLLATAPAAGLHTLVAEARWCVQSDDADAIDQSQASGAYVVTILADGADHPPRAVALVPPLTLQEDLPRSLDVGRYVTDDDLAQGDTLDLKATTDGPLQLQVEGLQLTVQPAPQWSGGSTIELQVRDSLQRSLVLQVSVLVLPRPDPPVLSTTDLPTVALPDDGTLLLPSLLPLASDPDLGEQGALQWEAHSGDPALEVVLLQDATPRLRAVTPLIGTVVTYTVRDPSGASASVQQAVVVVHANSAPIAVASSLLVSLPEEGSLLLPYGTLVTDEEDPQLHWSWQVQGSLGVEATAEGLRLVGPSNVSGLQRLHLVAADRTGAQAGLTVLAQVTAQPDAPVLVLRQPAIPPVLTPGALFSPAVAAVDSDLDHLTFRWQLDGTEIAAGAQGSVALRLWTLGPHRVVVTILDPSGASVSTDWELLVAAAPVGHTAAPPPPQLPSASESVAQVSAAAPTIVALSGLWWLAMMAASENVRFLSLKLLLLPLFTKLRPEEVLDHFTRGRIFGMIEDHPGINYTTIRKRLGLANGTLTHHLATLERQEYVRAEYDGLYKRFYPMHAPVLAPDTELSQLQADLLAALGRLPGISQSALSKELGVSKRVVHYHIHQLLAAHLVRVENAGRHQRLFAVG